MKIQNHSVINKWGDPYYVYILPIFPHAYYYYGDEYNGGNLFAMGLSNALSKGFCLIRKTGYENNLFSKHDDLF